MHAKDKLFDPLLHQATDMVDSTTAKNNHVLEELQRGCTISGRLLRCVMVQRNPKQESNGTKINNYAATACTAPKERGIRTAIRVPSPG